MQATNESCLIAKLRPYEIYQGQFCKNLWNLKNCQSEAWSRG